MATPNLKEGVVSVIDIKDWQHGEADRARSGPGFFMRSHENTPLRVGGRDDEPAAKDTLHVIDKRTLELVGDTASRAGQDARPRRVHARRPLRAGQPVGDGRRADRVRRRDPQGGEAHPDEASRRASTTSTTRSPARRARATEGSSCDESSCSIAALVLAGCAGYPPPAAPSPEPKSGGTGSSCPSRSRSAITCSARCAIFSSRSRG